MTIWRRLSCPHILSAFLWILIAQKMVTSAQLPVIAHVRDLTVQEIETLRRLFENEDYLDQAQLHRRRHIDVSGLDILSPTYFEHLVSRCTANENLPQFGRKSYHHSTIPIHGSDVDGKASVPKDCMSVEGFPLAMRVLPSMLELHLRARLQHEMGLILDRKTTSTEQMKRIQSLLKQYGVETPNPNPTRVGYADSR